MDPSNPHPDRLRAFRNLMFRRVRRILLVASAYDSFLLEEDGQLDELILTEFSDLSLRNAPGITRAGTGAEGLAALEERAYDLVITTGNLGGMGLGEFVSRVRRSVPHVPVVLLSFDLQQVGERPAGVDEVFLWLGDYRILFAIVKVIEDRWNAEADTEQLDIGIIILIEDNPHYYSAFLPLFYTELMTQSQRVISEGANLTHKVMRMRARPKILFSTRYEDALADFERYAEHVIGVISDVDFPQDGKGTREAGLRFARHVRAVHPELPIMLQSQDPSYLERARGVGAECVVKNSPTLLPDLRRFLLENFGFGDFVFRTPDGEEVGRAKDLRSMERQLALVPDRAIVYHAEGNHFSTWFRARTEFRLARRMRPVRVSDFAHHSEIRTYLVDALREFRKDRESATVSLFDAATFDPDDGFAKVGTGSLGGKARGLAFLRQVLFDTGLRHRFDGVRIMVPAALVLATDVFDRFLDQNDLRDFALRETDDAVLDKRFVEARFPKRALGRIKRYLEVARYPLAVRSSSLLEDSQYQPFAGVYRTFMVPNDDEDDHRRLRSLLTAVKRVYASTFLSAAKGYMDTTALRADEEKMAVLIQRVVGRPRGRRFYPTLAGVAQSHNFYPTGPMKAEDGIATVAFGLGRQVVEGGRAVRFSPRWPRHVPQAGEPEDLLRNAQSHFWAVQAGSEKPGHYPVTDAAEDGTLVHVASVYDRENHRVVDGTSRPGTPVVTFAPVLKYERFPLAPILDEVLRAGVRGMNGPVAFEFAADLEPAADGVVEFACLQMRPLVMRHEAAAAVEEARDDPGVLVWSDKVLGNGCIDGIRDVVVVDRDRFDRSGSREAAAEVAQYDAGLRAEGRSYLLVGVGRWGASDPWLGIPVTWPQISGARVIVEAEFKDMSVMPSQGSHFFHNLTAASVGYFTVDDGGRVDWDWLAARPAAEEGQWVRRIRLERPLEVRLDGDHGRGVVRTETEPPGDG